MDSADQARFNGDLTEAVAGYREAAQLIRELAQAEQGVSEHLEQLGSTLYDLGELLIENDAHEEAITALDEAEQAYESVSVTPALVADVRLRRATAHMLLDHWASALVDTQLAVLTYLEALTGKDDDPLVVEVARALARHSLIVLFTGDADVAVASADEAIRLYLYRADEINSDTGKLAVHGPAFHMAAEVAEAVHGAYGRSEPATESGELAAQMRDSSGASRLDLPDAKAIRMKLTLAEALDRIELAELRAELTRPAVDCEILTVADRVGPQLAHLRGAELAEVVEGVIDNDPAAAMRIALEAHGMLAVASELGNTAMRHQFGEYGTPWAQMLMRCSRAAEQSGRLSCAVDLANWMGGVVERLIPHAFVDAAIRSVALNCLDWHADVLTTSGDTAGAENARAAASRLAELG